MIQYNNSSVLWSLSNFCYDLVVVFVFLPCDPASPGLPLDPSRPSRPSLPTGPERPVGPGYPGLPLGPALPDAPATPLEIRIF